MAKEKWLKELYELLPECNDEVPTKEIARFIRRLLKEKEEETTKKLSIKSDYKLFHKDYPCDCIVGGRNENL